MEVDKKHTREPDEQMQMLEYVKQSFSKKDDKVELYPDRGIIKVSSKNPILTHRKLGELDLKRHNVKLTENGFEMRLHPRKYNDSSSTSAPNSSEEKFRSARSTNKNRPGIVREISGIEKKWVPTYNKFPKSIQYFNKIKKGDDYMFIDMYAYHSETFNKYLINHKIDDISDAIYKYRPLLERELDVDVKALFKQPIKIQKQYIYALYRKMHAALTRIIQNAPGENKDGKFIVYRGIRPERDLIQIHNLKYVQFNYFTSTSLSFKIAYRFASKNPTGSIIYMIRVPYRGKYLRIGSGSINSEEREILLPDTNVYKVIRKYSKLELTTKRIAKTETGEIDELEDFFNPGEYVDALYVLEIVKPPAKAEIGLIVGEI